MAYSAANSFAARNTTPAEWGSKNMPLNDFGNIAVDTPTRFILLSEALTKNEMIKLYDIVDVFLSSIAE